MVLFFNKYSAYFKWSIPFLAFILYLNTIPNGYNLDDDLVTINHRNTSRGLSAVNDIFSQFYYEDAMGYKYEYRPIVHLSFALEHALIGESPNVSHFINSLLYALLSYLLFVFLSLLLKKDLIALAWLASIIFVFHPVHTEVVASIKNRDEILGSVFLILCLISFLNQKNKSNLLSISFTYIFFVLAILSKPNYIILLYLIPFISILYLRKHIKFVFLESITLFVISYLFLLDKTIPFLNAFTYYFSYILLIYFTDRFKILVRESYNLISLILLKMKNDIILNLKDEEFQDNSSFLTIKTSFNKTQLLFLNLFFVIVFCAVFYFYDFVAFITLPFFVFLLFSSNNKASILLLLLSCFFILAPTSIYAPSDTNKTVLIFYFALFLTFRDVFYTKVFYFMMIFMIVIVAFVFRESDFSYLADFVFPLALITIFFLLSTNKRFRVKKVFSIVVIILIWLFQNDLYYDGFMFFITYFFIGFSIYLLNKDFNKYLKRIVFFSLLWFTIFNTYDILIKYKNINIESLTPIEVVSDIETDSEENNLIFDRPLEFVETPVNVHEPMDKLLATGMDIFGRYLKKTIIPYPMGFYYGYAYITPKTFKDVWPWVMLGVFIFLSLLVLYWIIKKQYILAFGLFIYLTGVFQALGIFYPIPGAMGDRFLFMPSIGYSILLAYPFYKSIGTKWMKPAMSVFVLILITYGYLTIQRNFQWKDKITLFEADIDYLNKSAQAQALLGYAYMEKSEVVNNNSDRIVLVRKARQQFINANNIYPELYNWWYDLGRIEMILGNNSEAIMAFEKANSVEHDSIPDLYLNLGNLYFEKSSFEKAALNYELAIASGANEAQIYFFLYETYYNAENLTMAIKTLENAIKLFPNDYGLMYYLGKSYLENENFNQANYYLNSVYSTNPDFQDVKALINKLP